MSYDPQSSHLFVLLHGLWGTPTHMRSLEQMFKKSINPKENAIFFLPTQNAKFKTFDGIEIIGYRALLEICQYIHNFNVKNNPKGRYIRKISVVGYSLGGLIARFIIGKLFTECKEYFKDIEPVLFLTMVSPHLGIRFFNPSSNFLRAMINSGLTVMGSSVLGKSGRELFITNMNNGILIKLTEGEYIDSLAKFKYRIAFANVKNDRTVAFYTAFITNHDPFIDTSNKLKYTFETEIPGSNYSKALPRIIDLTKLDPHNKRVITSSTISTTEKIKYTILFSCLFIIFFPIALIVNITGTIYSHVATRKYRKMIQNGDFSEQFKDRIGVTDQLKSYVSETYESVLKNDEDEDEDFIDNTSDLRTKNSDTSIISEDNQADTWNKFIEKYSSINNDDKAWVHRFRSLTFDDKRTRILQNLSALSWIRIPIYVKTLNAHGGIVARLGLKEDTHPTSVASVEFAGKLVGYLLTSVIEKKGSDN